MSKVAETTLSFSDVFKWEVGTDIGYCREVKSFVGTDATVYDIGTLVKVSGTDIVPAAKADASNVVGVLAEKVTGTGASQDAVVVVRGPVLVGDLYISFTDAMNTTAKASAITALQALGIKVATQV